MSPIIDENADIAAAIEATIAKLDQVKAEIGRVIFGQEGVVQDTLITLLQLSRLNFSSMVGIGIPIVGKFLHVADFNHDGRQDIAVASATDPKLLLCLASESGSTSCPMTEFALPGTPEFVGTVDTDLNGGTALAVVSSSFGVGTLSILDLSSGTPVILSTLEIGKTPYKMAFADVDCDGLRDAVPFHLQFQAADIFLNRRNGQFSSPATRIGALDGAQPASSSIQIFNTSTTDDLQDLVILSYYNDLTPAVLRVFKNVSQ